MGGILSIAAQTENKFDKSINKNGWLIPNSSNLKVINKSALEIDKVLVWKKELDFNNKKLSVELKKPMVCEIQHGSSYSLDKKVFAYEFTCVPFNNGRYNRKTKLWSPADYAGAIIKFIFYDDDGDGKFELRYSSYKMPIRLPNWARKTK